MNRSSRAIRLCTDPEDDTFEVPTQSGLFTDGYPCTSEGFYLCITGGAATSTVVRVKLSICG
jgi:hypothetical protein